MEAIPRTWTDLTQRDKARVISCQRKAKTPRMLSICTGEARVTRLLDAATREQRRIGANWYRDANRLAEYLAESSGVSVEGVCRAIAALSASCQWNQNLADVTSIIQTRNPYTPTFAGIRQTRRAVDSLHGRTVRLGREKITSFADNLCNPDTSTAVTVDTWMLRALTNYWVRSEQFDSYIASANAYAFYAEPIRRVAERRGVLPHVVQATAWTVIRDRG